MTDDEKLALFFLSFRNDPVGFNRKVLGRSLWPKQAEACEVILRSPITVIPAGRAIGKCVAENDTITLSNGKRIQAKGLVNTSFNLVSLVGGRPLAVPARAEENMVEPVYRITTKSGLQIARTAQHPLWMAKKIYRKRGGSPTPKPYGWTPVCDIVVGDLVAVAEELPAFGDGYLPEDEIKVLGYLIGDGGFTTRLVTFTQMDGAQLDEFRGCVERLGAVLVPRKHGKYQWGVKGARVGPRRDRIPYSKGGKKTRGPASLNPIIDILERHGLRFCHSRDKRVPDAIFSLSKDQIRIFLSRLFSTDGWACFRTSTDQRKLARIGKCTSDEFLFPEVRKEKPDDVAALGFEVGFCSISERLIRDVRHLLLRFGVQSSVYRKPKVNAWVCSIRDARNVLRFAERIGIFGKEDAVAKVVGRAEGCSIALRSWKQKDAPKGTTWDTVVSIEKLEPEPTVAIEVPGHHTYLTEFYEHNSYMLAGVCLWWLYTRPDSLVITTGPDHRQVVSVLWGEMRKAIRLARHPLHYVHLTNGYSSPQRLSRSTGTRWEALGFAANTTEGFSGQHAEDLLVIVDEASGITDEIWSAIHGLAARRLVVAGNPIRFDSHFRELHELATKGSTTVSTVPISCLDHPHASLEQSPVGAVSASFLRQMAEIHGRESPWWASNILGRFPGEESVRFIPLAWIDACTNPAILDDPLWLDYPAGMPVMAVDIGGGVGADKSVVLVRNRKQLLEVFASDRHGVLDDADHRLEPEVVRLAHQWGVLGSRIVYDMGGIGRSFGSYLANYGIEGAVGYFGGGRGGRFYINRRSANAFAIKKRLDPNRDQHVPFYTGGIPEWPMLRRELAELRGATMAFDEGEPKEAIEDKESLVGRLKHSSDYLDAFIMSFSYLD